MQTTTSCSIEWARLGDGTLLVASSAQAWLEVMPGEETEGVMSGPGSLRTTRKLLDGAIGAAFAAATPAAVPPLTKTRWAWRLAGMYHLTRSTTKWMGVASRRFAAQGRDALAAWADQKAREERGHDRLALRDLELLGYDAACVVTCVLPPTAMRLVRYFIDTVRAADPLGCVGYAYALERLATTVGREEIEEVEALLGPGFRATRCLRMHSAIGGDPHHVDETVAVVAELSGPERTKVARACHQAARLCFEAPAEGYVTDEEIERALRPFGARNTKGESA